MVLFLSELFPSSTGEPFFLPSEGNIYTHLRQATQSSLMKGSLCQGLATVVRGSPYITALYKQEAPILALPYSSQKEFIFALQER